MIILGIDPSLTNTGWAIINENQVLAHGLIKPNVKQDLSLRLAYLHTQLMQFFQQYKNIIHEVAVEESFVNSNYKTSLKLAMARGVIIGVLGLLKLKTYEYSPNAIKKYMTGFGHADKNQIKFFVENYFKVKNLSEHENDAIAIAFAHSQGLIN